MACSAVQEDGNHEDSRHMHGEAGQLWGRLTVQAYRHNWRALPARVAVRGLIFADAFPTVLMLPQRSAATAPLSRP